MTKLEELDLAFPDSELNCPIGFEDCVIGVDLDRDNLVLDATKIIDKIVANDKVPKHEAVEHFFYNIHGSKGKGYDAVYVFTESI